MLCVIVFHALIGGGQTPILSSAFHKLSSEFDVSLSSISLTTGAYMLSLGIGGAVFSPTAIVWGKRVVYLSGQIIFVSACIWGALAHSYGSLLGARILQGFGVSPCEILPSSSIAEIFFLHERAFRLGLYTMLLLGGKNLMPLVGAVIIDKKNWRWVFIIMAIIVGFNLVMTFFTVTETVWDRNTDKSAMRNYKGKHRHASASEGYLENSKISTASNNDDDDDNNNNNNYNNYNNNNNNMQSSPTSQQSEIRAEKNPLEGLRDSLEIEKFDNNDGSLDISPRSPIHQVQFAQDVLEELEKNEGGIPGDCNDPEMLKNCRSSSSIKSYVATRQSSKRSSKSSLRYEQEEYSFRVPAFDIVTDKVTGEYQFRKKTYREQLSILPGRYTDEAWLKILVRPIVLIAYPGIAFSTVLYSVSVVWLIVLSEVVSQIFSFPPFNFSPLGVGLLFCAPFIGGLISGSCAGKVSDIVTKAMARRNGGVYEPEFRLLMVIPVCLCSSIGLIGLGWSSEVHDKWIVPAVFFGFLGFGCTLGSTVSLSYTVDCYRPLAGEALVTLNLTKNIIGFIMSLFMNSAVEKRGVKNTFLILGGVHIIVCFFAIPLYIYGKRARSWTARKNWLARLS